MKTFQIWVEERTRRSVDRFAAKAAKKKPPRRFAETRRPVWILAGCIVFALSLYAAGEAATGFRFYQSFLGGDPSRLLFICYLLTLFAIFFAYFISAEIDALNTQTLRHLLRSETYNWGECASEDDDIAEHRRKGESVITAQAIFIAISVFLIGSIPEALNAIGEGAGDPQAAADAVWQRTMLQLCLGAAMVSFVLLLISIDAVETIFNRFRERESQIVKYFYTFGAKRKYYGFVLSFTALAFYVSATSPNIASLSIGAFIAIGYHCWFPDVTEHGIFKGEARLFRTALWVAPILMMFAYGF